MLPIKIKDLVFSLINKTESGLLTWDYNDEDSLVFIELENGMDVRIRYRFDFELELATFTLFIFSNDKEYVFTTNQNSDDYFSVRRLFESAQASDLNFDI